MTQEIAKYNVHTKAHKRKLIKRWLIAIVVLAIIIWAFAGVPSLELKSKSLEILNRYSADYSRHQPHRYTRWRRLINVVYLKPLR